MTSVGGARRRPWLDRVRMRADGWSLLALPAVVFLGVFFLVPLVAMSLRSVTDPPGAGLANYEQFFAEAAYVRVLMNTFWIALLATVACLVVGYPFAYLMTIVPGRFAGLLLIAVLLPFWSSLLVRTFAWQVLLRDTGVINRFLLDLGVINEPLTLIRTTGGVIVGMSHILLPFMVLPLYAVMRRIDPEFGRAAANLGASPMAAFLRVFVPLSLPGCARRLPARVHPGPRLLHHPGAPRWPARSDDQPADRAADPAAPRLGLRHGDERPARRRSRWSSCSSRHARSGCATSSAAWSRTSP